ncbi:MAG TPA: FAD:protein FMN transferase [Geminicoccaceae bacterium]|nr:FAD:protein FMN transferase [Geminicoccaceae bacterium]
MLQITAGLTALGAGPAVPEARHFRWTGSALGAVASLDLRHTDRRRALRLVELMVAEIARLEAIFSLQRADSALSRLNLNGRIAGPPFELVVVLEAANTFSRLSEGAFDVTVQPLWRLHADAAMRGSVPDHRAVERVLGRVGWQRIDIERRSIAFQREGMAATLNGIAQGYITDRVTDLLRDSGVDDVLVDLGEPRASGSPPTGHPWRVRTAIGQVLLADEALAVSCAQSADCCLRGGSPNVISPLSGLPVLDGRCVAVRARSAMLADAASTALAASSPPDADALSSRLASLGVNVVAPSRP